MYFKMIAQFLEGSSPPTKNTPSHCAPPLFVPPSPIKFNSLLVLLTCQIYQYHSPTPQ